MNSNSSTPEGSVTLSLSRSQALVLFDFLSRFSEDQRLEIRDQAEQRVLWDMQADLESSLSELLAQDYTQHLEAARDEVRDKS